MNMHEALYQERQKVERTLEERWKHFDCSRIRGMSKYKDVDFLQGVEDPHKRRRLGVLCENAYNDMVGMQLSEDIRAAHMAPYEKYVLPTLRFVFANLLADNWVTIQTMPTPEGRIFYMDMLFGTAKGRIAKGQKMFDALNGPSSERNYANEVVETETLATGTGSATYAANTLDWLPVRAGTVRITDGTQVITDDGSGGLEGDTGVGTNSIDYNSGLVSLVFAAVVGSGTAITVDYEFIYEQSNDTPAIDMVFTSSPIITREDRLRARWSLPAQQDAMAYHGIDIETEVVGSMGNEISRELNERIARDIRARAGAPINAFDKTIPFGISLEEHYSAFMATLNEMSNEIYRDNQRFMGTFIIGDIETANVIENMAGFVAADSPDDVAGPVYSGKIGRWSFYKHPNYPAFEFLIGHKPTNPLHAAYIHAVYTGLMATPVVTLDDFKSRMGVSTRTAQRCLNPRMFKRGTITESSS